MPKADTRRLVPLGQARQVTMADGWDGPLEIIPMFRYDMAGWRT